MKTKLPALLISVSTLLLPAMIGHAGAPVKVQILSATIKDQRIAGATVILQKNGSQSMTAATDAQGVATLAPEYADGDAGALVIVKKTGYSTLVAKCPCAGMTYAISPVMTSLDGLRVVLNWGAQPLDLDSHLLYPGNHIFWNHKFGTDANLDVDDTDGYGPETITLVKKHEGDTYVYAVHSFSDRGTPFMESFTNSRAKVFVYIGQSLIKTYYAPVGHKGKLWVVFTIDEQGEFHDVNAIENNYENTLHEMSDAPLIPYIGGAPAAGSAAAPPRRAVPVPIGSDGTADAIRINKQGETAYHAGKLEQSIELYRQAIELDGNYGQAYSNLGLSYQKSGRIAEAIWANRKALQFAHGPTATAVRASSYYNIAKIYENAGQFTDAQRNYEAANREKSMKVYTDAIARMKTKQRK